MYILFGTHKLKSCSLNRTGIIPPLPYSWVAHFWSSSIVMPRSFADLSWLLQLPRPVFAGQEPHLLNWERGGPFLGVSNQTIEAMNLRTKQIVKIKVRLVHYKNLSQKWPAVNRGWLPTDMDAFFNFSLFVLFIKTKQDFQNKTGLSIPVNLNAFKRKEGRSHCQ